MRGVQFSDQGDEIPREAVLAGCIAFKKVTGRSPTEWRATSHPSVARGIAPGVGQGKKMSARLSHPSTMMA
jgi:hypothetical protein